VAVIGAGPSGLVAAKHALEAGFDVTVFEASDDLGGQWHADGAHSGVWPGMRTNTSCAMPAFSDLPPPPDHPVHPAATQIHAYLRGYAERFGVTPRIRLAAPVREVRVRAGWTVDGEPFEAVVLATGRFGRPHLPDGLGAVTGELLHAFDYPGAEQFRDRATLVYGSGISALEIASDLAPVARVVSAFRKQRYVIQKIADGVLSDWRWFTLFGALERRHVPREELGPRLRDRIVQVSGSPADFGAPAPDPDIFVAGIALCQDYLAQVADGTIVCRPAITAVEGRTVTFADGSEGVFDAIVCATGYDLDVPYLDADVLRVLGPELALAHRTLHPDVPGLAVVGLYPQQGPYLPVLELQARWAVGLWSGALPPPDAAAMRRALAEPAPPLEVHNALAATLAEQAGVAPDLEARPGLAEPLLFGPMLPPRYRLDGPGAQPEAEARFRDQLAASPRAPVDPAQVAELRRFGLAAVADAIGAS
jgi:dimethylaniline monooxygenase (N-oxide forming)